MVTLNTEAASVAPPQGDGERGFGVVEIVVSMFLLLIIAVAFLPLLIQGYKISVVNSTVAAATQLANQQVERVRSSTATAQGTVGASCAAVINSLLAVAPASPADVALGVLDSDHKADRESVLRASGTLMWDSAPTAPKQITQASDCTMGATPTQLRLTTVVTDVATPAKPLAEIVTLIFVAGA